MVRTHPLWREFQQLDDDQINRARIGPDDAARWQRPVRLVDSDPRWPNMFREVADRVGAALGFLALSVDHVGSTSVPGLAAKPVIDVDLLVADPVDEAAYLPRLEAEGFGLVIREPDWEEHRMLKWYQVDTNLHVFAATAIEPRRHIAFRDWLSTHSDDRDAYAERKRELAAAGFTDVMHYTNAKGALIYDIYEHVFAADPRYAHDPHPRST